MSSSQQLIVPSKKPGKGGARPGSGRKPGGQNEKTRRLAEEAKVQGTTPIDVMLKNMRYYDDRAEDFDNKLSQVANTMTVEEIKAGGEKVMDLLKLVAKIGEFRMKAQECAVDAAPYVHPRLSAIAVKVRSEGQDVPKEITAAMTPRLAAEAYQAAMLDDE